MPEKEVLIALNELTAAEVKCHADGCSASVVFDINGGNRGSSNTPSCPVCGSPMEADPEAIAQAWETFCLSVKKATISFRIKQA